MKIVQNIGPRANLSSTGRYGSMLFDQLVGDVCVKRRFRDSQIDVFDKSNLSSGLQLEL